jgi:hypothetical protein
MAGRGKDWDAGEGKRRVDRRLEAPKKDHELYRMYINVQHVSNHPSTYLCLEIAVMVYVLFY